MRKAYRGGDDDGEWTPGEAVCGDGGASEGNDCAQCRFVGDDVGVAN